MSSAECRSAPAGSVQAEGTDVSQMAWVASAAAPA